MGRRRWPAYHVWGTAGYFAGLAVALVLSARAGLSAWSQILLALVPITSLYLAVRVSVKLRGRMRTVFFEKAIAAVCCTALALAAAGEPVWPGVEVATLGVGTFLAFGRMGCLAAGCCHGRPARVGVRYGYEHVTLGIPFRWVDVPLLPTQLIDGAVSAASVAVGTAVLLAPHAPGAPVAAYACCYGLARFALEPLRGDAARPSWGGLSEAQWIATGLGAAAAIAVPAWWTMAAAAALGSAAATLIVAQRYWPRLRVLAPRHLSEVETALHRVLREQRPATTSQGVHIAAEPGAPVVLAFSLPGSRLSPGTARRLVDQVGIRARLMPQRVRGVQQFMVDHVPLR